MSIKQGEAVIIPIGIDCSISHYLRRKEKREKAYPFDWNVTPVTSALRLIQNGFEDFLEEKNLIFLPPVKRLLFEENGIDFKRTNDIITPVICKKYSILYPHDFSKNGKGDLAAVKEKYERRIERLKISIRMSGNVLLVFNNIVPNDWQLEQYKLSGIPFPEIKHIELKKRLEDFNRTNKNLEIMTLDELKELLDS